MRNGRERGGRGKDLGVNCLPQIDFVIQRVHCCFPALVESIPTFVDLSETLLEIEEALMSLKSFTLHLKMSQPDTSKCAHTHTHTHVS